MRAMARAASPSAAVSLFASAEFRVKSDFHDQDRQRLLHCRGATVIHGETILEMIQIGNCMQQIRIAPILQFDVPLQLRHELLLHIPERPLTVEQIGRDQEREYAESEEGETQRPLFRLDRMHEHQRIHQQRHARRHHEDNDGREDR